MRIRYLHLAIVALLHGCNSPPSTGHYGAYQFPDGGLISVRPTVDNALRYREFDTGAARRSYWTSEGAFESGAGFSGREPATLTARPDFDKNGVARGLLWAQTDRSPEALPPDTLRILSYNIHHGEGMDGLLDLERIAGLIRSVNPDLVALQEIDSVAKRTGGVDQARELGRLTALETVFGRFMAYDGGAYGMALLSRWPITESENLRLPDGEEPRSSLKATVTSPKTGRSLVFVGIHFYRTETERLAQSGRLEEILADQSSPVILAGDFNSRPGSQVIQQLEREWVVPSKGEDHLTFPSYSPEREIDFLMYRPAEAILVLKQQLLHEPIASDHRPLVAEVLLWDESP